MLQGKRDAAWINHIGYSRLLAQMTNVREKHLEIAEQAKETCPGQSAYHRLKAKQVDVEVAPIQKLVAQTLDEATRSTTWEKIKEFFGWQNPNSKNNVKPWNANRKRTSSIR